MNASPGKNRKRLKRPSQYIQAQHDTFAVFDFHEVNDGFPSGPRAGEFRCAGDHHVPHVLYQKLQLFDSDTTVNWAVGGAKHFIDVIVPGYPFRRPGLYGLLEARQSLSMPDSGRLVLVIVSMVCLRAGRVRVRCGFRHLLDLR
jgi:hypothetical protein